MTESENQFLTPFQAITRRRPFGGDERKIQGITLS